MYISQQLRNLIGIIFLTLMGVKILKNIINQINDRNCNLIGVDVEKL